MRPSLDSIFGVQFSFVIRAILWLVVSISYSLEVDHLLPSTVIKKYFHNPDPLPDQILINKRFKIRSGSTKTKTYFKRIFLKGDTLKRPKTNMKLSLALIASTYAKKNYCPLNEVPCKLYFLLVQRSVQQNIFTQIFFSQLITNASRDQQVDGSAPAIVLWALVRDA